MKKLLAWLILFSCAIICISSLIYFEKFDILIFSGVLAMAVGVSWAIVEVLK